MKVRKAYSSDVSALAALERLQPLASGWGVAGFSSELLQPSARMWCACEGDKIIGFLSLRTAADFAEILNVAVHPAYTRRGVGKTLLAEALAVLKNAFVRQVTLEAEEGNLPAEALYAAAGFKRLGLRKDFYGPGRSARIWEKEL